MQQRHRNGRAEAPKEANWGRRLWLLVSPYGLRVAFDQRVSSLLEQELQVGHRYLNPLFTHALEASPRLARLDAHFSGPWSALRRIVGVCQAAGS